LWLQADNTVKEVKNATSAQMMCALVTSNFFEEAGHYHLPVGHTHEDVDALFGLITGMLSAAGDSLQTPEDFKRLLESKVAPMFEERGEFFHVVLLDAVPRSNIKGEFFFKLLPYIQQMFIPWHEIPSMRSLQFPASFSKP